MFIKKHQQNEDWQFNTVGYDGPVFTAKDTGEEVKIFFRPSEYTPNRERIQTAIAALQLSGHCIGGETKRLGFGEIDLFFNPLQHTEDDRRFAMQAIEDKLLERNPAAMPQVPEDASEG